MEEIKKEIGKRKFKMVRLEEWNPTLEEISKKRNASSGCTVVNKAQRVKLNPPPPPPPPATNPILIKDTPPPQDSIPSIPSRLLIPISSQQSIPGTSPAAIQSNQQKLSTIISQLDLPFQHVSNPKQFPIKHMTVPLENMIASKYVPTANKEDTGVRTT